MCNAVEVWKKEKAAPGRLIGRRQNKGIESENDLALLKQSNSMARDAEPGVRL